MTPLLSGFCHETLELKWVGELLSNVVRPIGLEGVRKVESSFAPTGCPCKCLWVVHAQIKGAGLIASSEELGSAEFTVLWHLSFPFPMKPLEGLHAFLLVCVMRWRKSALLVKGVDCVFCH